MLDIACQKIGALLVPVYPTINVTELEFILNDAQVKLAFVNDDDLFHKVFSIKQRVPTLKEIYTFEHVANAKHWKEVSALGHAEGISRVNAIGATIAHEDLATIIYTSGTTGVPKGVMLSHRNIVSNVVATMPCFCPGNRALSFLPLNHIFERMVTYLYLFRGVSIYYAESMETIAPNLREVKPHMFTTVPRLLEKVYERIMHKGSELTGFKKRLFYWAHSLAEKYDNNKPMSAGYRMRLMIANKLIFSKWREALGNQVQAIVTGGAAAQVRLIRIFTAARIVIMEGYGLTETSPVISVNRYHSKDRMIGTVGPLIDGVSVKIAEDGEILCKGPNIMMGYYKRPDLTAEVITDGWFHTGDIGMLMDNKFLRITDRKKELFKTSGGKYVAPLAIENKLKESQYIEQVMLVGAEKKYVSALIVPSFPNLREWCRKNGLSAGTNEELIHQSKVTEFYRELIDSFNKFFNHVEQVKKFELLPNEWSIDTGEMTPKLSLKRKVVMEKYRNSIEKMYS
jgi:long-chain acyl-CoA synthetase